MICKTNVWPCGCWRCSKSGYPLPENERILSQRIEQHLKKQFSCPKRNRQIQREKERRPLLKQCTFYRKQQHCLPIFLPDKGTFLPDWGWFSKFSSGWGATTLYPLAFMKWLCHFTCSLRKFASRHGNHNWFDQLKTRFLDRTRVSNTVRIE